MTTAMNYEQSLPEFNSDKMDEKELVIKYEISWCNGDPNDVYDTLEEAKKEIDKYRDSHDMDYGLIRTIDEDGNTGDYNEFSEDWEIEE